MSKKFFVLKLMPCRTDFAQTMTAEERTIMQQHINYWKDYMRKGIMLLFGPVLDPKATYGLGIIAVDDESQVEDLLNNDPTATINKYEYYPMMAVLPEHIQ